MTLSCYVLEGTWWSNREVPQVLPYFTALANSADRINLSYRTFRNIEDVEHWVSRIGKNERAFLYFACHGEDQQLIPADGRSPISNSSLLEALDNSKKGAIEFLHFSCCEMISRDNRRESLQNYLEASKGKWVSGYRKSPDWLQSMLLDLALVADLAVPYHNDGKAKGVKLSFRGRRFLKDYRQPVESLGFSGAYSNRAGNIELFPRRHRNGG